MHGCGSQAYKTHWQCTSYSCKAAMLDAMQRSAAAGAILLATKFTQVDLAVH
jgi:hypothetical protein